MTTAIKKLTSIASVSAIKLKDIIWRPLWRILTFSPADDRISPQKNLCISIEKENLTLAYGSRFLSKIKIKGVREFSFEEGRYPQADGLASSIALVTKDFRPAKTEITLSIPKAWAIIKTAEFPVTVKENLSDVISYELDRLTPFSPEDTFYDFKILNESAGRLYILVIAAKADMVKPYIEALREKGFIVNSVTVNLSGIGTLCRYMDKETDFIFIEINSKGYEGALFINGILTEAFSGSFTTDDEKSKADAVMTEISSIIAAVQKKQGKLPKIRALFRPSGSLIKDESPSLKELLKLQTNHPVKILNETDIKFMSKSARAREEVPHAAIGGMVESLWPKANGLNLLKKGLRDKPKYPKVFTIILMLSIIAMWVLYMIVPLRIEQMRLNEIDHQIMLRRENVKKVEALKKETDTLNNETNTINNFKENRPIALNMLKELTDILPKTAWLTRVRITESTVDIEGYATSASLLLPKLEASNYFKKAEFASPTFRDARMNADRFSIKMEIEGVKKDERVSPVRKTEITNGKKFKNEKK